MTRLRGFTIRRRLAAPPDRVFRAWTDADELVWFGGPDAEHAASVDLRAGGCWRAHLVQPDGERYWSGGTYREVAPDERISFCWGTAGGWPDLDPDRADENPIITVALTAVSPDDSSAPGLTDLALHIHFPDGVDDDEVERWLHRGIETGWADTVDRLVQHLGHQ